jgi:phage anti-repressor protein
MQELIKVNEKKTVKGIPTVNARDLWIGLGSKQRFADWIKERIKKYGFVNRQDYTLHKIVNRVNGHQGGGAITKIEYHISLDMAKELAMVENNEKGRRVRQYFIAAEKGFREKKSAYRLSTEKRNLLTESWQKHGCTKRQHFINLTKQEYKELGFEKGKKKSDFNKDELITLSAFEGMETFKLNCTPIEGYHECKESLIDTAKVLRQVVDAGRKQLLKAG